MQKSVSEIFLHFVDSYKDLKILATAQVAIKLRRAFLIRTPHRSFGYEVYLTYLHSQRKLSEEYRPIQKKVDQRET